MTASAIASPVDCEAVLPGFTFSDCYGRAAPVGLDAIAAAKVTMSAAPGWAQALLKLRNRLGSIVGLRAAPPGGFPVISEARERVVLGFNDWHLDFRIVVTARPDDTVRNDVTLTTIVRTHNVWGRAYLAAIMPFHRAIARAMANRFADASGEA